jgi:molybdenum cofactor cytidylyltransferase
MVPVGILLAAGRGSRFDPTGIRNKLLQPLPDGQALAVASARALLAVLPKVVAVVPPDAGTLARELRGLGCDILECGDAAQGMGHSLAAGIAATAQAPGWLVALADMPFVQASTIARLSQCLDEGQGIVAPVYQGRRGHPVGFHARYRSDLLALRGDQGARALLKAEEVFLVDVDDAGVLRDIDTPMDLAE